MARQISRTKVGVITLPDGNYDCPYCNGTPPKGGCDKCGGTYDGDDD